LGGVSNFSFETPPFFVFLQLSPQKTKRLFGKPIGFFGNPNDNEYDNECDSENENENKNNNGYDNDT
jgi:hypothetical protein